MTRAWRERLGAGTRSPLFRLLYALYERRLLAELRHGRMPGHIGIILDGHRRYARARGLTDPKEIYALGARKLDDVLDWCGELGIPAVTLWVFSTENLRRPAEEVSGILGALEAKLEMLTRAPETHRRRVRVRAVGKLELLPDSTLAAIHAAEDATARYDAMMLTIAVAYGGREEIADAIKALLDDKMRQGESIAEIVAGISQKEIARYLYTADLPDPDLIIRTSGEIRLSGFLLWQSAYSEFYFSDVYWPDFRKVDFLRAVRAFQQRERRFGQ
jgi:short-chain Z-isoprenyl diphosphate synthase